MLKHLRPTRLLVLIIFALVAVTGILLSTAPAGARDRNSIPEVVGMRTSDVKYFNSIFLDPSVFFVNAPFVTWSTTSSAWLTVTNWTGGAVPTGSQTARFGPNPPSAVTGVGINMGGSTNNGSNNQAVGAIEILSTRTANLIIGNSNVSVNGILTLNGVTVNNIDNVILSNNSDRRLTIQNTQGASGVRTMGVALGNATENIVNVEMEEVEIQIAGIVSGAGRNLTKAGAGVLTLMGVNTYSGNTTIRAGSLNLPFNGSIANSPVIEIGGGAFLDVQSQITSYVLANGQDLRASGTTSTGAVATTGTNGLTTAPDSEIIFSAFNGTTPPLAVSGNAFIALQASNPVTVTVANGGTRLGIGDHKLISKLTTGNVTGLPTTLTVNGDGVGGTPSLVLINGEMYLRVAPTPVLAPEIVVEGPGAVNIDDDGAAYSFGGVDPGYEQVVRTFTIRNTGTGQLNLTLPFGRDGANAGDFTVDTSLTSSAVAAGGSTTFAVTFATRINAARTAAVHIASNETDENPFDINLAGSGQTVGDPDLAFMESLRDNRGFAAAFGWPTTRNPCPSDGSVPNWPGVTCSDFRVAIIAVGCIVTPLTTQFPGTEIASLTALISLEIRGCYRDPQAPQAAGNFAPLDTMTQLTSLRLDDNPGITGNFSDVFPLGLSPTRFPALGLFFSYGTSLGGQIPDGVMQFGSNRVLRMVQMRFSGELPAAGNPSKDIYLSGNVLEGVLPDYIRNATGRVRIGWNKFDVVNTPPGTIDTLDPGWRDTQTVPPTGVQVTATGAGTATLTWTPIAYQEHGGYYEVLSSQTAGGPYVSRGTTAGSGAKTATGLTVSGLPGGTNYFVLRTVTPAHTGEFATCAPGGGGGNSPYFQDACNVEPRTIIAPNNPNDLTSVNSAEVSSVINTPPSIAPQVGVTRQRGSAFINSQIATVSDPDQTEETLVVTVRPFEDTDAGTGTATETGVTVSNIAVSDAGVVTADVVAACNAMAAGAIFSLRVTDSTGAFNEASLTVTVTANPPPTLSYNNPAAITIGGSTTINPATGPQDNGTVQSIGLQSAGTYTGGVTVNNAGVVSISSTAPVGTHTITIRATDDCGAFTDATLMLEVTNTAPTLTYNNASVAAGGTTTVNAATGPQDNGTVQSIGLQSAGTYTGGVTVNSAGVVSISGAAPVGTHTITIRATDDLGAFTDASFTLEVTNTPPTITAATGLEHLQGSAGSNSTIATVTDSESGAGVVIVTVTSANPSNGVTISNIVNTNGTVTADIVASCTAANAMFTLTATDGGGATATAVLTVTVTANAPPTVGTYANQTVAGGGGVTVTPLAAPADNGSIASVTAATSPNTFTGTLSTNAVTGAVTIVNANPPGVYTIAVTVTDNCGATAQRTFTLTVALPTLGVYPATAVGLSGNAVVIPVGMPTNTTSITVSAPTGFIGELTGDPVTGVVRVTNAALARIPAGAYPVTVRAFGPGGTAAATFDLTITATPCAGINFVSPATAEVSAGSVPRSVAIGDFNSDGIQDFAAANQSSNNVSIRLGNGSGGFTSPATAEVAVGSLPLSVAIGDFNGDGFQDFATANAFSASVSIRRGNGSGGFTLPAAPEVVVGLFPISVAIGDFNGDGLSDFATANFSSNNVSIRLGNGSGGFTSPAAPQVAVGTTPASIAIGDFNGDGFQDFATANANSNNVSIRLGNGGGGFTLPAMPEVAVGSLPRSVAIGDFNGDGLSDFAAANADSDNVSIRLGNGSGGFTSPATPQVAVGSLPLSVAIGDFNGDGNQDFAAANANSNNASIRLGNGSGGFTSPATPQVAAGTSPFSVAIGDFNGDGIQDFATANLNSDNVSIRLGSCNTAPTITAAEALARQQGSAGANSQIATVSDAEQGADTLAVTVNGGASATVNGVTVSGIAIDASGNVTADIIAVCTATNAAFTLTATDSQTASTNAMLTVNVTANTPPVLTYAAQTVAAGTTAVFGPVTGPGDNGTIGAVTLVSITPVTGGAGGLALTVDPANGQVNVTGATIAGTYTVAISVTDNCGAVTTATFTVEVACPTITIAPPTLPNGTVNAAYSQTVTASPSGGNYTYGVSAGALPNGLSLRSGGAISGTPTTAGTFNFTITATGFGTCTGSRGYTVTIEKADTIATITSDNPDPSVFGGTITVIYTIAAGPAGPAVPTGNVVVTISGASETCTGTVAAGSCTMTLTNVGTRTITAAYAGDANFNASSDTEAHTVNRADTLTTVVSSSATSTYGDAVTFTATVAAAPPGAGVPAGTVVFRDGAGFIPGCDSVALVQGAVNATAQCTTATINAGVHTIRAEYGGNANFNGSMGEAVQTVNKKQLTVTAENKTRVYGAANPPFTAIFTGFVLNQTLATSGVTGVPQLTTTATPSSPVSGSPYTITAALGSLQSNNYSFTFVNGELTITKAVLTVTADSFTRVFGAPNPALTVQYTGFVNGEVFATSGVTGAPVISTTATPASPVSGGPYPITVLIGTLAAGNYDFMFVNGQLTITRAATTTTITNAGALGNPTTVGQSYAVNFTVAPVAPITGTPKGTVTVSDGAGQACTASVAAGTCSLTATTPGVKTITASYPGDGNFTGSVSRTITQTVVIRISGNIREFIQFGIGTNLPGVTVALTGSAVGQVLTDANGNFTFELSTGGGNYTITPTGLGRTYEPISRTYTNVSANITNANFIAYNPSGPGSNPREVRVENSTATTPGETAEVPVVITNQGNEAVIAFSLLYDVNVLGIPTVTCGTNVTGCAVTVNNSLPGMVGVTITPTVLITPGTREIARVIFPTFANTLTTTTVSFGDFPTTRDIRNSEGNPLPTLFRSGLVVFTQTALGLEGDVVDAAGAPAGGDGVLSNDINIIRQFALGSLAPDMSNNQFQRGDISPRDAAAGIFGDGRIDGSDVTLARLYNLGLLPPTTAAGPVVPSATPTLAEVSGPDVVGRTIRAVDVGVPLGATTVTVSYELEAQGDEVNVAFTTNFNSTVFSNPVVALGSGVPVGATLFTNVSQPGRVGVIIDSTLFNPYAQGRRQILTITFTIAPNTQTATFPVTFSSSPVFQSVSNVFAVNLPTAYEPGNIAVGSTAAGVTVSGRVTTPSGQGLRNATVFITDAEGNRRTVRTSSFGVYTFEEVEAGGSYVVGVTSKRYRFGSRVVNISDNLADVNFVGLE